MRIEATELTKNLMKLSGSKTHVELMNNALTFFAWALNAAYRGKEIAAVDQDEQMVQAVNMEALTYAAELGASDRASVPGSSAGEASEQP